MYVVTPFDRYRKAYAKTNTLILERQFERHALSLHPRIWYKRFIVSIALTLVVGNNILNRVEY